MEIQDRVLPKYHRLQVVRLKLMLRKMTNKVSTDLDLMELQDRVLPKDHRLQVLRLKLIITTLTTTSLKHIRTI